MPSILVRDPTAIADCSVVVVYACFQSNSASGLWLLCVGTTVGGKIEITDCELVWNTGQNCFGINRDFYLSNTDLFKDKSPIVAGGTTYYIDAMDLPTNCNSAVALVYVANTVDGVDGYPNTKGGALTADLSAGDDWHLMPRTGLHPLVEFS